MPPTTLNTKGSASPEDVPHGTWDFFPWEPFPEYAGSKSVLYRSADRRVVAGATRESGTGTLTYPCDEFFYVIEGWARLVVHGREMFTLDRGLKSTIEQRIGHVPGVVEHPGSGSL
ncbi:hypothetical protein ACJZ2D_001698 [Fusarium nematophilum]